MPTSHSSRVLASGDATTFRVPIPVGVVTDPPFPFGADDEVTVSIGGDRTGLNVVDIGGDRPVVTAGAEEGDE